MAEVKARLPHFRNPPVVETALSVTFSPLLKWNIGFLGHYWSLVRDQYPNIEVAPPVPAAIEVFGDEAPKQPTINLELGPPKVRCWFSDATGNRLIQVQHNRFTYNWRRVQRADAYPRYSQILPNFIREWARYCDFLKKEADQEPMVNQAEVNYSNHIERGHGWEIPADLSKILAGWSGQTSDGFLPKPDTCSVNVSYPMPGNAGRLRIVAEPAIRILDGVQIIQIEVTARVRPKPEQLRDIGSCMDLAHEWVVRGFTDFTSVAMHKLWGRLE
jgi:uncharacterized protein (TIGR04255 family)